MAVALLLLPHLRKNNGKVELLAMTRQKMSEANDSFFLVNLHMPLDERRSLEAFSICQIVKRGQSLFADLVTQNQKESKSLVGILNVWLESKFATDVAKRNWICLRFITTRKVWQSQSFIWLVPNKDFSQIYQVKGRNCEPKLS